MMKNPRWTPIFRPVIVTVPTVGAEWTVTPQNCAGWLIRSLRFFLASSAVAATRVPALSQTDGSTQYARHLPGNGQTAGNTFSYAGVAGLSVALTVGSNISFCMPTDGIWLPQGHVLASSTDNRDGGDQFSNIVLGVIEFPSGAPITLWPSVDLYDQSSE